MSVLPCNGCLSFAIGNVDSFTAPVMSFDTLIPKSPYAESNNVISQNKMPSVSKENKCVEGVA